MILDALAADAFAAAWFPGAVTSLPILFFLTFFHDWLRLKLARVTTFHFFLVLNKFSLFYVRLVLYLCFLRTGKAGLTLSV